jgi:hypothetical protein
MWRGKGLQRVKAKIAAFGSSYTISVGAAEGCDLLIFNQ